MDHGGVAIATVIVLLAVLAVFIVAAPARAGAAESYTPWTPSAVSAASIAPALSWAANGVLTAGLKYDGVGWYTPVTVGGRLYRALVSTGMPLVVIPGGRTTPVTTSTIKLDSGAKYRDYTASANVTLGGVSVQTALTVAYGSAKSPVIPMLGLLSNRTAGPYKSMFAGLGIADNLSIGCMVFDFTRPSGSVRLLESTMWPGVGGLSEAAGTVASWNYWLANGGATVGIDPNTTLVGAGTLVPRALVWEAGFRLGDVFVIELKKPVGGVTFMLIEVGTTYNHLPAPPTADARLQFAYGSIPMRKADTSKKSFTQLGGVGVLGNRTLRGYYLIIDTVNRLFAICAPPRPQTPSMPTVVLASL